MELGGTRWSRQNSAELGGTWRTRRTRRCQNTSAMSENDVRDQKGGPIPEWKSDIRKEVQYQNAKSDIILQVRNQITKSDVRKKVRYQKRSPISERKSDTRKEAQYQTRNPVSEKKSDVRVDFRCHFHVAPDRCSRWLACLSGPGNVHAELGFRVLAARI